jgi:hypothetical protein
MALSNTKLLDSTWSKKQDNFKKQIKLVEIILPVVIIVIVDPVVTLIINLVLITLDLTWSWNLVYV